MALPYRKWVPTTLISEAIAGAEILPADVIPSVTIRAVTASITEGGTGIFRVTKSGLTQEAITVGVQIAETGTTITNSDALPDSVEIPGNALSVDIEIPTTDDILDEPNSTITATLQSGNFYSLGVPSAATITVRDDDLPLPTITITRSQTQVEEGTGARFRIESSRNVESDLTIHFAVTQVGQYVDAADLGDKFVVIRQGEAGAFITIDTVDDSTDEQNGSVTVTLSQRVTYQLGTANAATVVIADNDFPPPSFTITRASAAVDEGDDARFTVRVSRAQESAVDLNYRVSQSGSYVQAANLGDKTLNFPAGSETVDITIPTVDDSVDETNGTVTVELRTGSGYTLGNPMTASLTVRDDDLADPVISVSRAAASVVEGSAAQFTIRANRSVGAAALTVNIAIAQTGSFASATDLGNKTVEIPANAASVLYEVPTINDQMDESNGTITLSLRNGSGYTLGSTNSQTVTIADDDLPLPAISITRVAASVVEGTNAQFNVRANRNLGAALTVNLVVSQSGNYVQAANIGNKTVQIPANGSTVVYTVATVNDQTDEPNGSVTVALRDGTGYTRSATNTSTVEVRDNDEDPRPANYKTLAQGGATDWNVFPMQLAWPTWMSSGAYNSWRENGFDNEELTNFPESAGNPFKTYNNRLWAFAGTRRYPARRQGQTTDLAGFSEIIGGFGLAGLRGGGKFMLAYDPVTYRTYALTYLANYNTFSSSSIVATRSVGTLRYQEVFLDGATGTESGTPVQITRRGNQGFKQLTGVESSAYNRIRQVAIGSFSSTSLRTGDHHNTILKHVCAYNGIFYFSFCGGRTIAVEISSGNLVPNRNFAVSPAIGGRTYYVLIDDEKIMYFRPWQNQVVFFRWRNQSNHRNAGEIQASITAGATRTMTYSNPTSGVPAGPPIIVPQLLYDPQTGVPQARYEDLGFVHHDHDADYKSFSDGHFYSFDAEYSLTYRSVDIGRIQSPDTTPLWRSRRSGNSSDDLFSQGAKYLPTTAIVDNPENALTNPPDTVGTGSGIENRDSEGEYPMKTGHPLLQPILYGARDHMTRITIPAHNFPKKNIVT